MTSTIRDILGDRPVHSVAPATTLRQAARLMAQHGVGALAVLDGDRLLGILSERDIVFRAVGQGLSVDTATAGQIMTPDPVTVGIDDAISDTLAARLGDAFRHLPVMDAGRVAGLLSFRDIPAEYVMLYERFREMAAARPEQG